MRGNKSINIAQLQQKFAAIQAELKKALDSVEADQYITSIETLSRVTKYIVVNCENLGLALENVPFEGFDGPKFWRTLNQCWIFALERASIANNAAIEANKDAMAQHKTLQIPGNAGFDSAPSATNEALPPSPQSSSSLLSEPKLGTGTEGGTGYIDVGDMGNIKGKSKILGENKSEGFEANNFETEKSTGTRTNANNSTLQDAEPMIFDQEYMLNLEEKVVAWSESLACYGLVDYEMGFWETDIMDTLESIRKSIP